MLNKHYYTLIKTVKNWTINIITIGLTLIICCYLYGTKIEPNWIETVYVDLPLPNLSQEFNNFKLVQISDIHVGNYMPESRLDKILRLVNQQQADAIVITGDIITKKQDFTPQNLINHLLKLSPKEATLAVLGNHERVHQKIKILETVLIESNIINLDNQIYVIHRGSEKLIFAGIDDPYVDYPNLTKVIEQRTDNSPVILLVHEPDFVDISAKTGKFALQLSGHSHGGQIKMPFFPPLILPNGGKKYFAGLNKVDNTLEYTNRGLGMTGIPIRFNCRPEITVFTLTKAEN